MSDSWLTEVLRDPIMKKQYESMMSEEGRRQFSLTLALASVRGAVEGFALLALIPTVLSLVSGEREWGLPLLGWLTVLAVAALVGGLATYWQNYLGYLAAMNVFSNLHRALGDQMARLPLGWFGPRVTGMLSRLGSHGIMSAGEGLAHMVMPIVSNAITVGVLLIGTLIWQPALGLVLVAAVPLATLASLIARYLKRLVDDRTTHTNAESANRIVEFAACQPALRAAGRSHTFEPLHAAVRADGAAHRRALWFGVVGNVVNGVAIQAIVVSLIIVAARLGESGMIPPAASVAFIGISLRFTWVLQHMLSYLMAIENARTPLLSYIEILEAKPLPEPDMPATLTRPGEVIFEDVTFGYDDDPDVIRDVSFTVAPRTMTAIVGPSGSGKTTLFRLLARFWDVRSGAVRVGGIDVREQSTAQLMAQLSMVFQDVYLYDQTLHENIAVGREGASETDVQRVADLAGVSEITERLPHGWNSRVGERGGRLSGGERQRVSVARALLKGAPIVLFDEATSALDPENEAHIAESMQALRAEATVLVIAHKLSTVRSADQIVVLNEVGEVAQVGTHDELVATEGVYRDFWDARRLATGWQIASASGPTTR
ncbi:MAG: ABC transporter ATP-binding protein [Bowdeniella nasicola]|nr:ABC transporter ATP-binding protein [Bowdeniella nasicola]